MAWNSVARLCVDKFGRFKEEDKMISGSKKCRKNFSISESFQVRLILTMSLFSPYVIVKSKLATGDSFPSSQT